MKKKLIILVIVLLVAAIGIGLFFLIGNKEDVEDINFSATQRGWMSGTLGKKDILILKSITHQAGGDSKAEFQVYRIAEGEAAASYMHLKASEIGENSKLEHIGNASCTFIGGDLKSIYDLKILYLK